MSIELAKLIGFDVDSIGSIDWCEINYDSYNIDKDDIEFTFEYDDGQIERRCESIENIFDMIRPIYFEPEYWNQIEEIDRDSKTDSEFESRINRI